MKRNSLFLSVFLIFVFLMGISYGCASSLDISIPINIREPYLRNVKIDVYEKTSAYEVKFLRYGSGIIWDKEYVLTVAHLVGNSTGNYKNLIFKTNLYSYQLKRFITTSLKIDKIDIEKDLMLLKMEQKVIKMKPPKLVRKITLTEKVLIISNPSGIINSIIPTNVINIHPQKNIIVLKFTAIPGMSGGGVWNKEGELVGIVQGFYYMKNFNSCNCHYFFTHIASIKAIELFFKKTK